MIGYHASHEQFSPLELKNLTISAESSGFGGVLSSDHITPWSLRQGHSGNNWPWLGAAMQQTSFPFSSLVIPGGWRYHPVVAAQAFATLGILFPGRIPWIAAGSGESMNEHITGEKWPNREERNARLQQGVEIMRALWRGETVTVSGLPGANRARIWSLPDEFPAIYGAAISRETAGWMGQWADGLLTVYKSPEVMKDIIFAFRDGGGTEKPLALQLLLSWDATTEQAQLNAFDQWRHCAIDPHILGDLQTPEEFDAACQNVLSEDMKQHMLITSEANEIIDHIHTYRELGFESIYLHNAGRNQREFIDFCRTHILPSFR
jgi:coenzyme F420-dependent glucose-6-phosphate dehydrogenase